MVFMERITGRILFPAALIPLLKNKLMFLHPLVNRFFILGLMVLVGFSLAKSIQLGSVVGFILALVSLSAGIYFLYILAKAQQEVEAEES